MWIYPLSPYSISRPIVMLSDKEIILVMLNHSLGFSLNYDDANFRFTMHMSDSCNVSNIETNLFQIKNESLPKQNIPPSIPVPITSSNNTHANIKQESSQRPSSPSSSSISWSEFEPEMKKVKIEPPDSPELIIDKEVRKCPRCLNEIEVRLYWL